MSKSTASWSGVLGLALLFFTAQAVGQEYQVKLSRPEKVGNKYEVTASGSQTQRQGDQSEAFKLDFAATATVLAVDNKSHPTKISWAIKRCTKVSGDKNDELIPAGKVLMQEQKEGRSQLTLDDKAVDEALSNVVDIVLPDMEADAPRPEEIFSTDQKVKVGDTWKINAGLLCKALSKAGKMQIKEEDVTGECKLTAVKQAAGKECLQIEGTINAKNIGLPVPETVKVEKAELALKFAGLYPTDGTSIVPSNDMDMKMTTVMKGKNDQGQEVTIEIVFARTLKGQKLAAE